MPQVPGFTHVPSSVEDADVPLQTKGVHPAILQYCSDVAAAHCSGVVNRVAELVGAVQRVVSDFEPREDEAFSRALDVAVVSQVAFVERVRPLTPAFSTVIRYLRSSIARQGSAPAAEAKAAVIAAGDEFVRDRIRVAHLVAASALEAPERWAGPGSTVLLFGRSTAVLATLLAAHARNVAAAHASHSGGGKTLVPPLPGHAWPAALTVSVVVVDARPRLEGAETLRRLASAGIPASYAHISSALEVLRGADAVLLGAAAVLGDGSVLGRSGSALLACAAKAAGIPVIVAAESFKFTDRVVVGALGQGVNECFPALDVAFPLATEARAWQVPGALQAALRRATAKASSSSAALGAAAGVGAAVATTGGSSGGAAVAVDAKADDAKADDAKAAAPQQHKAPANTSGGTSSGGLAAPTEPAAAPSGGGLKQQAKPKQQQQPQKPQPGAGSGGKAGAAGAAAAAPSFPSWASSGEPSGDAPLRVSFLAAAAAAGDPAPPAFQFSPAPGPLSAWRDVRGLCILPLAYDVTPAHAVARIVCEAGCLDPGAVGVVVREFGALEEGSAVEEEEGDAALPGEEEEGEEGPGEAAAAAAVGTTASVVVEA